MSKFTGLLTQEDYDVFNSVYAEIVSELLECSKAELGVSPKMTTHFVQLLDNVLAGKKFSGLLHVAVFKCVSNPSQDELRLASIFGWLLEIMQGACLIVDDIMDGSCTRLGKACWYKLPEIGLRAINDHFLLEQWIYFLLHKYFGDEPSYPLLHELIRDAALKEVLGQALDLQREGLNFTEERYRTQVNLRTSYSVIHLPVQAALVLAAKGKPVLIPDVESIALQLGHYFGVQNDYHAHFGDNMGQIETDIVNGRCSWLVVSAIRKATPEQVEELKKNYGRDEANCVDKVVRLYQHLDLREEYRAYEEKTCEEFAQKIKNLEEPFQEIFFSMLEKQYKPAK